MGGPKRADDGGLIYHVLNRGNARMTIFHKDGDFEAFERILEEAVERFGSQLLRKTKGKGVHPGLSWVSTKWVGAGGNLRLLACCEVLAHIGKRANEWFGCR